MALTNLQRYVKIFIDKIQDCENELQKFARVRSIEYATGILLDIAAEIVGLEREGRTDSELRLAIRQKIMLNKSNGEPETVIQGVRIFANATLIKYTEVWPAKVRIEFSSLTFPPDNLIEALEQIAPAGVKITLGWIQEGPFFAVGGEGGYPPLPNTAGCGEDGAGNENIGGHIVEEI